MMNIVRGSMVVFVGWLAAGIPAAAQTRMVIVNGQRVSDMQEVAEDLSKVLQWMHGRVRADEVVLPVVA